MTEPRRAYRLDLVDGPNGEPVLGYAWTAKPVQRGECRGGPRPCPWVSCRYNLSIDNVPPTRSTPTGVRETPVPEGRSNCVLDYTDRFPEGLLLEEVAEVIGASRQAVHQCMHRALARAGRNLDDSGEAALRLGARERTMKQRRSK